MYLSGKLVHADYMFNGYSNTKKDFMKQVSGVHLYLAFSNSDPLPCHFARSVTAYSWERTESLCRMISSLLAVTEQKSLVPTLGRIPFQDSCRIWFHSHHSPIPSPPHGVPLQFHRREGGCQLSSQTQRTWKRKQSVETWTPSLPSPAPPQLYYPSMQQAVTICLRNCTVWCKFTNRFLY